MTFELIRTVTIMLFLQIFFTPMYDTEIEFAY